MSESSTAEKSTWNSLEKTKLFISILTPLVITVLGIIATMRNEESRAKQQEAMVNSAYEQAKIERDETKNRDITKNFIEHLQHEDACKNSKAIALLVSLATPEYAEKLQTHYIEHCKSSPNAKLVDEEAAKATNQSQQNEVAALINDLQSSARRSARTRLTALYQSNETLVAPMLASAIKENFKNYQVTLGALVVLGSVNNGWNAAGEIGSQFNALGESFNMKDSTFKEWYNKAKENKK